MLTIYAGCTTDPTGETRWFVDDTSKLPPVVTCYCQYLYDASMVRWRRICQAIKATENRGTRVVWDVQGTPRYESSRLGRGGR